MTEDKYKLEEIERAVQNAVDQMTHERLREFAFENLLSAQLNRSRPKEMFEEFMRRYGR